MPLQDSPKPRAVAQPAFAERFVALYDELLAYLFRLTAHRADAEDLAQQTYLKASHGFAGFRGRSSFKTWVFTIATNLARDHFRARQRWYEDSQDRCRETTQADAKKVARMHALVAEGDAAAYEFREHISYCFTCIGKTLPLKQQLVVLLKEVYRFKVSEIQQILAMSEGQVKHALGSGRRTMTGIFEERCSLISKRGACHQCSEMAGFVNPRHDAQVAANQQKLAQAAEQGASAERLLDLRAALFQHLDPLAAPMASLHEYLLELVEATAATQHAAAAEP